MLRGPLAGVALAPTTRSLFGHPPPPRSRQRVPALARPRHTALTHEAAASNPHAYVQAKAGQSRNTITDCYIHAGQLLYPGAVEKAEARI